MAEKLHACLVQYFARLEKLNHKWQELSKNAEIPLMALANQAEQFRSIITNPSTESTENAMHKEMLERFIFNILMRMEDEVRLLLNILTQFNDANQNLKNYLDNLENARSKISLKDEATQELINGTPHRPRLNMLLIWAVESFQFYHKMYLQIKDSMNLLDYKAKDTIDNLISSFKEDKRGRKNTNRILAFTQFLAKETLRQKGKDTRRHRRQLQRNITNKN
ncbi:uncharacterized protein LOC105287798 [Ooceraea biroi]|uniref:uncharacterized protein LOC105287798 n=1 Tax=Ooceraea biroi TaxID=2015173 RepID=UPI0005B91F27|nr:uncharacterized protein LOC105287798 [Ooceraea biroi]